MNGRFLKALDQQTRGERLQQPAPPPAGRKERIRVYGTEKDFRYREAERKFTRRDGKSEVFRSQKLS